MWWCQLLLTIALHLLRDDTWLLPSNVTPPFTRDFSLHTWLHPSHVTPPFTPDSSLHTWLLPSHVTPPFTRDSSLHTWLLPSLLTPPFTPDSSLHTFFNFLFKHILGSHTGRTVPQGALLSHVTPPFTHDSSLHAYQSQRSFVLLIVRRQCSFSAAASARLRCS